MQYLHQKNPMLEVDAKLNHLSLITHFIILYCWILSLLILVLLSCDSSTRESKSFQFTVHSLIKLFQFLFHPKKKTASICPHVILHCRILQSYLLHFKWMSRILNAFIIIIILYLTDYFGPLYPRSLCSCTPLYLWIFFMYFPVSFHLPKSIILISTDWIQLDTSVLSVQSILNFIALCNTKTAIQPNSSRPTKMPNLS